MVRTPTQRPPIEPIELDARLHTCDIDAELALLFEDGDGGTRSERRTDLIAALKQLPLRQRTLLALKGMGYTALEAYERAYGHRSLAHASETLLDAEIALRRKLNGEPDPRGGARAGAGRRQRAA